MRSQLFRWVEIFSAVFLLTLLSLESLAFEIDLSRRKKKSETNSGALMNSSKSAVTEFFSSSEPRQEIAILNTETGFIPSRISLKKGNIYRVSIVNVNKKEKNVSFMMDAFSEHHATFYGQITTFEIRPAQEGVFSFQCPETSTEGRIVVIGGDRMPAIAP